MTGGQSMVCVLLSAPHEVRCWGQGAQGQMGSGDTSTSPAAGSVVDLGTGHGDVVQISAGGRFCCALFEDGQIKCWGVNDNGRIGSGSLGHLGDEPNEMGDNLPTIQLGTGMKASRICDHTFESEHTCVLLQVCPADTPGCSKVKCWGGYGGLGYSGLGTIGDADGEMGDSWPFVDVGATVQDVPGGLVCGFQYHTCVLVGDGDVRCWGDGDKGQIGMGSTQSRGKTSDDLPMPPPNVDLGPGLKATWLSPGPYHTCAMLNNGEVKCWGYNYCARSNPRSAWRAMPMPTPMPNVLGIELPP